MNNCQMDRANESATQHLPWSLREATEKKVLARLIGTGIWTPQFLLLYYFVLYIQHFLKDLLAVIFHPLTCSTFNCSYSQWKSSPQFFKSNNILFGTFIAFVQVLPFYIIFREKCCFKKWQLKIYIRAYIKFQLLGFYFQDVPNGLTYTSEVYLTDPVKQHLIATFIRNMGGSPGE